MSQRIPEDIDQLLQQLDNYEDIERIQKQWLEYAAANEHYERNYPQQFGNLVEANLKFKEQKSIPTPAEQMRSYNDLIRSEIVDLIEGRDKDQVYELEEGQATDKQQPDRQKTLDEFRLTFDDISYEPPAEEVAPQKDNATTGKGKVFDFNLVFDNMDDLTRQELEREDLDLDMEPERE